jgi:hypothetical protein
MMCGRKYLIGFVSAFVWATLLASQGASAQIVSSHEYYDQRLREAQNFATLDESLFGDNINLQDGTVRFEQTDVSIPTNSGLKVAFGRKTPSSDQGLDEDFATFGKDWEPNVPYMMGTYDTRNGWINGTGGQNRCSTSSLYPQGNLGPWPYYNTQPVYQYMYWHGININIPGEGEEQLLKINAAQAVPTDGKTYYGTTKSSWRIREPLNKPSISSSLDLS